MLPNLVPSPQKRDKRDGRNALVIGNTPQSQQHDMKRGRHIELSQEPMRQPFPSGPGHPQGGHVQANHYSHLRPPPIQVNDYSHFQPGSGTFTSMQSNNHSNLNYTTAPDYFLVPAVTPNGEYSSLHVQPNILNSSSADDDMHQTGNGEHQKFFEKMIQEGWQKVKNNEAVFDKRTVSRWKNAHDKLKGIEKKVRRKSFWADTSLERRMLAAATIMNPKESQEKAAMSLHLARMATFQEFGLLNTGTFNIENISLTAVSADTIGNIIRDIATDLLFLKREELLSGKSVAYMGIDKGPRGDFVKVICQYDFEEKRVKIFMLDNEKSGGTNKEAAEAIKFSIERMQLGEHFRFGGFTSDSGGGGTREGLMKLIFADDIMSEGGLVGTCTLHSLQLLLSNPVTKWIGEGGVEARNALQLIHAVFDLQKQFGVTQWQEFVTKAADTLGLKFCNTCTDEGKETEFIEKMQAPVLTRWWTVGKAARLIANNLKIFKEVVGLCIESQRAGRDKALSTIANRLWSLFCEETILSDLMLIHCYNNTFISKHFEWLQGGDPRIGNTPGFYGRNMLVRYFLLRSDLEKLSNDGWKTSTGMSMFYDTFKKELSTCTNAVPNPSDIEECFVNLSLDGNVARVKKAGDENEAMLKKKFREIVDEPLDPKFQEAKARNFFDLALKILDKHFARYIKERLVLGVFGETPTASILAKKILNPSSPCALRDGEQDSSSYFCEIQDRDVDLFEFAKFLDARIDTEVLQNCPHIKCLLDTQRMNLIASGVSIWESNSPQEYLDIQQYYLEKYSAFLTSTHCVEAGVKKSKDADNGSRSELRETHYIIGSNLVSAARYSAIKRKQANGTEYKSEIKARGKDILAAAAYHIQDLDYKMETRLVDPEQYEVWLEMRECLSDHNKSFKKAREEKEMDAWRTRSNQRSGTLKGTQFAHMKGFDVSDSMTGRVPFKQVKVKSHHSLLKCELVARGVQYDATRETFTELKGKLRKDEIKRRQNLTEKECLQQMADQQKKDAIYKKITAFEPLHGDEGDWFDAAQYV